MSLKNFNRIYRAGFRDRFDDEPPPERTPLGLEKIIVIVSLWIPALATACGEFYNQGFEYFTHLMHGELAALIPISAFTLAFALTNLILVLHHENRRRDDHDRHLRRNTSDYLERHRLATTSEVQQSLQKLATEQVRFNSATHAGIQAMILDFHRHEVRMIGELARDLRKEMLAWIATTGEVIAQKSTIGLHNLADLLEEQQTAAASHDAQALSRLQTAVDAGLQKIRVANLDLFDEIKEELSHQMDKLDRAQQDLEARTEASVAELKQAFAAAVHDAREEASKSGAYYAQSLETQKRQAAAAQDKMVHMLTRLDDKIGVVHSAVKRLEVGPPTRSEGVLVAAPLELEARQTG